MTGLSVGLDLGTSGVRSAVLDPNGTPLSMAKATYGSGPNDRSDPNCWWRAVCTCLLSQMEMLRADGHSPADITGIAVDGTSGSLLLTDAVLNPVTRALMYDDVGFDAQAAQIAQHAPDPHVARGASSALARALRLIAEDTDKQAAHLLHQADFIAACLRGGGAVSDVNNALKTGCDPATITWPDWIEAVLPAQLLPQLVLPGTATGTVAPGVADALGLPSQTQVHAGTTDSIAAFLAAAPAEPGAAVTSIGTTLAIKLFSETRIDVPEMGIYAHRLGSGWLVGGASNSGGGVLRAHFSDAELSALSEKIDPSRPTGLDYYPLVKPGERFPINDPNLPPQLAPRPEDDAVFLQGIFEGIAEIEAKAYTSLRARGAPAPALILTAGGAAQNDVFTQIRERIIGMPVQQAPQIEAAIGAARLAMQS